MTYEFKGNFSNLKAGLTAAGKGVRDFGNDLTALDAKGVRMRAGMTSVGATGGKVALGIGAALGASAKAAIDWESAWAGVTKTVDATANTSMADLEQQLRDLTGILPASHEEIAGVAEAAGQLGIGADDVASFTKVMIELGETTNLSADEAATSLARISNIMGTSASDVDRMGASIVALGNNSATTEAEIVGMATRLAAAGRQAGLSEADIFAIASTMTSVGVEAEAGGTALSKVFTTIGDAVRSNSGELETFAKVAGVTTAEFKAMYEASPAEAIGGFVDGMGQLATAGGDTTKVFKELGLTDSRLKNAVLSAGSATGMWADQVQLANAAWADNTALTEEAEKRFGTTASQIQLAINEIRDAAIDFGETVLPMVAQVTSGVASAAQAFGDLPTPIQDTVTKLAALTAITGGSLWFGSKVVNGVASTREALVNLGLSADQTRVSMSAIGKGFSLAATVTALTLATDAVDALFAKDFDSSNLSRGLDALARGEYVDNLDTIGDKVADLNTLVYRGADLLTGWFPSDNTRIEKTRAELEKIDEALAQMVETGDANLAARIFDEIVDQTEAAGGSAEDAADAFNEYALALRNAGGSTGVDAFLELGIAHVENNRVMGQSILVAERASGAVDGLAGAADGNTYSQKEQTKAVNEANRAMLDQVTAAGAAFDAETRWGQAVMAAREQVEDGTKGLNKFTEDGQANRAVLSELQAAWNNQSKAVINNTDRYEKARATFVGVAKDMGVSTAAANRLADQMLDVPRSVLSEAVFKTSQAEGFVDKLVAKYQLAEKDRVALMKVADQASGPAAAIKRALDEAARDRQSTITVRTTHINSFRTTGDPTQNRAGGGYITGPGTGTSDDIPAYLSNGEYVIKASAVEHYGVGMFDALNARRFADGGSVDGKKGSTRGQLAGVRHQYAETQRDLKDLRAEIKGGTKDLRRLNNQLDKASAKYERESRRLDQMESFSTSVGSSVANASLFGGGLSGLMTGLSANRND
ncbi:MAG: phage tail tape measure protein, partial [Nocardioides sp.]|nr:phage tail tape measure protein [Nocardioides sp.]